MLSTLVIINTPAVLNAQVEKFSDEKLKEMAIENVKSQLNDPYSAQFTPIVVEQSIGFRNAVGCVNAKNAYGGYVGLKPFVCSLFDDNKLQKCYIAPQQNERMTCTGSK